MAGRPANGGILKAPPAIRPIGIGCFTTVRFFGQPSPEPTSRFGTIEGESGTRLPFCEADD
jgi:hypothetical protein